jgi:hypothetical protein
LPGTNHFRPTPASHFVNQLDARHFLGTLKFNHVQKTMEIKVDLDKVSRFSFWDFVFSYWF